MAESGPWRPILRHWTAMATDAEIRGALDEVLDRRDPATASTVLGAGSDDLAAGRRYLAALVDGGWMVPTWPVAHGGRAATADEATRIGRILGDYAGADLYPYGVGLSLVGPVLRTRGSDEQCDRWLRAIADGSEIWCQMFSEPDAGSDLANAGMRAVRDGDEWVLDGSKVWTSRGAYSRWGLCLARTDPDLPKHRGLTMFAVDMERPGIDVRPLVQVNGDRHFTEVFVDGARVPDTDRVGAVGEGWGIAVEVLALERASLGGRSFGGGVSERSGPPSWMVELRDAGRLDDPVVRQRAVQAHILDQVNRLTLDRAAGAPGPAGSGAKLRTVAAFKARAHLVKDVSGAAGMLEDSPGHLEFLTAPSMSIRGGTDEVQRNIVGERVLGLPPEPRVDKDVPWSTQRGGGR